MASQGNSPKLNVESQNFNASDSPSNEAETSLNEDICGYCGKQKRPERSAASTEMPHLCQCPNASESTDPSIRLGTVPSSAFRRSPSPRPSIVPPAERSGGMSGGQAEQGKVEILSIREKHGYFRKAVPHMPVPVAVFLCLLNVLLPGSGTFFSTFTIFCGCTTDYGEKRRSVLINLLAALLQLLMAPLVVGWIWSVLWGITFVNISVSKEVEDPSSSML